jgi:acetate kinase
MCRQSSQCYSGRYQWSTVYYLQKKQSQERDIALYDDSFHTGRYQWSTVYYLQKKQSQERDIALYDDSFHTGQYQTSVEAVVIQCNISLLTLYFL